MARDEIYDIMKQLGKEKFASDRKAAMEIALQTDDGLWNKHTEFHWSRIVSGQKLNYWPSRRKFQYDGKVRRGDVLTFISIREAKP